MAQDIVIPTVGESITEGVIGAWTKADGEWVERDETVIELETDKITMEIPAPASGLLRRGAAEGDTVAVGAVVGSVDESAEKPKAATKSSTTKSAATAQEGAAGVSDRSSTAVAEPPAKPAPSKPAEQSAGATTPDRDSETQPPAANGDVRATPLAKKLATEKHVDLHAVQGTGPGGRVREQDVLAAIQGVETAAAGVRDAGADEGRVAVAAGPSRAVSHEKMSPMRQRIAARLVDAQHTAAMLTTFNEVDMTAVMETRKQYKEAFTDRHGVGLGFMSFFVKAVVGALRAFPRVNASIVVDAEGKPAIESHDYQDVAIAVSSPKGLVVPVLRNAETLSFAQIEAQIKDFGTRAKEGRLGLDEMQGGTFTITNGGVFGSLLSTPILNPPQSGILGMHGIKNRAVEHPDRPGEIALRPMMYLALSYDHRIVDGSEAVRFLVHVKDAIEDPKRLLLDL
ncbi:MAG: 2-oxoglutarate dehydrogenase complex dihydrolipoyllysine-residue succinyltransferase [Phycisphaeraceae bacterium]|nr:MAG: 2-oxoglutarate dehydrogenase complex dihydrolipoyllysine-residue succinyltransferase [Phycisphaeraceae bacterium]